MGTPGQQSPARHDLQRNGKPICVSNATASFLFNAIVGPMPVVSSRSAQMNTRENVYTVVDHYENDRVVTRSHPGELAKECPPYFIELLRELHRAAPAMGVHFLVTGDPSAIPEDRKGPEVVAILYHDERSQVPPYARQVHAVFRGGTKNLQWPESPFRGGFRLAFLKSLRLSRDMMLRVQRRLRLGARLTVPGNVFSIPIGTKSYLPDTPSVEMGQRSIDLSLFAAIGLPEGFSRPLFAYRPKILLRQEAYKALAGLRESAPHLKISMGCSDDSTYGAPLKPEDYEETLRQTKVSPCPGGNFMETHRHFESARAGCVIISEVPPQEWYYEQHPFVLIDQWRDLPKVTQALFADPAAMKEKSRQARQWWDEKISPAAVARYILHTLRSGGERGLPPWKV